MEKLRDSVNMGAVNSKLLNEKLENLENKTANKYGTLMKEHPNNQQIKNLEDGTDNK